MEEREIFKICLEYWAKLVAELYEEIQQLPSVDSPLTLLGRAGINQSYLKPDNRTRNYYHEILSRLRVVMIEHMVKPEEVRLLMRWYREDTSYYSSKPDLTSLFMIFVLGSDR